MERQLERKPQKLNPHKRMNSLHPFFVWRALERFRVMDKLAGVPDQFHSLEEVAGTLFTNFHELTPDQQKWVVQCKLSFAMHCVAFKGYAQQEQEEYGSIAGAYYRQPLTRGTGRYRSLGNHFTQIKGYTEDMALFAARDTMDRYWAVMIGRRDPVFRWLEKEGLEF